MARASTIMTEGEELPSRQIGPISQTDIVRFAGAGGDFNPLHHDAVYARRAGLPGVIAMGQMQAGMLASWVADVVGVENVASFSVRFASPLAIGETLTLNGRVDQVNDGVAELALVAAVGERVVVSAKAHVRVAS